MQRVKMVYVDAQDGRPATEASLRHGFVHPVPVEQIDYIDRSANPAVIVAQVADDVTVTVPGVLEVMATEDYSAGLDDYLAREKQRAVDLARMYRKQVAGGGTYFDYDGQTLETRTDRATRDDVRDVLDQLSSSDVAEVHWEYKPHDWALLDQAKAEALLSAIRTHRSSAFQRQHDLEQQISSAATLQDMRGILRDMRNGWPEMLGDM